MNIYAKLQKCRVELQNSNLKKSGCNKFAGYDYFELGDFLPKINELMLEHAMSSHICFMNDMAILRIVDSDNPTDSIEFASPIATAQLKGCHDIQNLGAVQTYLRRYLWTNAMEISEHDALDATTGKEDKPKEQPKKPQQTNHEATTDVISDAQAKRLFAVSKGNAEGVKTVIMKHGYTSTKDIKKADYDKIVKDIEAMGGNK